MRISRQRIGLFIGLLLVAAVAVSVYVSFPRPTSVPRHGVDADFQPQVYIWQRAWTDSVRRAVQSQAAAFARIVVLARQIDFDTTPPHVTRVQVDWPALKASNTPVAAAIRIGVYTGPFEGPSADLVCESVRSTIDDARAAGITLAEIQIDFDAPTSKLPAYRTWLAHARKIAAPVPLTFTALPTWLNSSAFSVLARDAGYFVLQVHWLEHPHRLEDPLVLCDLPTARRAIAKAARLNVPFRVALPTYSYVAAFNADGSYAGMTAEGAPPNWGENKTLRLIEANPEQLAAFINELAANRPMSMRGIIWYRFPIDSDRLNWSFSTLQSVMKGQPPRPASLTAQPRRTSENLYDILLTNTGQKDADANVAIALNWSHANYIAADALAHFQLTSNTSTSLELLGPHNWQSRLKPGESRIIAWLRLNRETDIHASIHTALDQAPPPAPPAFSHSRPDEP